jgi:hypothetical protein
LSGSEAKFVAKCDRSEQRGINPRCPASLGATGNPNLVDVPKANPLDPIDTADLMPHFKDVCDESP